MLLSVFTLTVKYHEPSYRIFRSMLEVNLVLWGASVSIFLWSKVMGREAVDSLMFQPLFGEEHGALENNPLTLSETDESFDDENERAAAENLTGDGIDSSNDEHSNINANLHTEHRVDCDNDDMNLPDSAALDADMDDSSDGILESPLPEPTTLDQRHTLVTGLALDMLLAILVTLFLFMLSSSREKSRLEREAIQLKSSSNATNNSDADNSQPKMTEDNAFWKLFSQIAAPTFPLLLFLYFSYRAFFPWKNSKRRSFWIVVSYTLMAPWFPVSFRDGFIGDVLTSSVRPLQDIVFTVFYILFGLKGWWSTTSYRDMDASMSFLGSADANIPTMEQSWIVHTVLLPLCSASPLWWWFLQNLRQTFDEKQRWPYLGNALKYFCAAQVAMFGVFHPDQHDNPLWLAAFVLATLYQIWWDVFMDWGLLEYHQGRGWGLRSVRLYKSNAMYWIIGGTNLILRFGWTLSFVPLRYLDAAGVLTENFEGNWVSYIVGPTLASAEIIRRTMWGFLRFEWEVIKSNTANENESLSTNGAEDGDVELRPMSMEKSDDSDFGNIATMARGSFWKEMSTMNPVQIIGELTVYATIFCLFCFLAAAHRGTY